MKRRILVVRNNARLTNTLCQKLRSRGFDVALAADGSRALNEHSTFDPDLVLLDLALRKPHGLELCRKLNSRQRRSGMIIFAERRCKADGLEGLRIGADDCLTKPFAFEELLIRIEAVLRRIRGDRADLMLGLLQIDFQHYRARRGTEKVLMSYREIEVLRYMSAHAGHIVTRDDLLRSVWGYGDPPLTRCVDHLIYRLRRKIEPNPENPQYIQSVYADGYRLVIDP